MMLITHSYLPERTPPQRRWQAFVRSFREAGWEVDVVVPRPDRGAVPARTPAGSPGPAAPGPATPDSAAPGTAGPDPGAAAPGTSAAETGPVGERVWRTPRLSRLDATRDGRFLGHVLHALTAIPVAFRARRPDVVVMTVPALPTVVAGWAVSRLRRAPLIVEMRDAWPDLARESGVKAGALSRVMEALVTGSQRASDLVVTVTEGFGRRLSERGVGPVAVVGNGVGLTDIAAVPARRRAAGELNVLYLGNHGESQGLETIIRAAALTRPGPERITVRMVGSGTRRAALSELNESLGRPVTMLEPVFGPALREQYAWADTCVVALRPDWPSFEWTIPSKTYELLAVGRHITGLVTGEAARILAESGAADLTAPEPAEVAALWRRLAADPASTETDGTGRRWVAGHADLPELGRRFVGLAVQVVDAAGRRRRFPRPPVRS